MFLLQYYYTISRHDKKEHNSTTSGLFFSIYLCTFNKNLQQDIRTGFHSLHKSTINPS